MKKGIEVEGVVEKINFPNKCVVRTEDGETLHVKDAYIGQKVLARVLKKKGNVHDGQLLKILEKATNELPTPYCPHFYECGGCTYQNISYEDQLKLKESQIKELFSKVIPTEQFEKIFEGIKGSPIQFEYRNKMEFSFGDLYKDGPLALGMHKKGSFYDIVDVRECKIIDSDFRKILAATSDFFNEINATFFHKMRHEGYLRHLLIRKAKKTGQILVDLITSSQVDSSILDVYGNEENMLNAYKDVLIGLSFDGELKAVLHTKNDSLADAVVDEGTTVLYGEDAFVEELLGLKFKITPFSFFQTNSLGAEFLYETAREYIGELGERKSTVFDLYSGTGTIAQMLAPSAKKVIGVEIIDEAVEAAKVNAKLNGLDNVEFIANDVLKALDDIDEKPDFIVLDPPRDGINPKALEKILNYNVDRLIYISCKPTSLVRDLEVFKARGYNVERMCCVDLFPATVHVETVVLLSDKKVDSYVDIDLEVEKLKEK